MNKAEQEALLAVAEKIAASAVDLTAEVRDLRKDTERVANVAGRAKRLTTVLFTLLALVVILGGSVMVLNRRVSVQAARASSSEVLTQNNLLLLCQANNESNATQLQLWLAIFALPPTTPQTAQAEKTRAEFLVLIRKTFAPRSCG